MSTDKGNRIMRQSHDSGIVRKSLDSVSSLTYISSNGNSKAAANAFAAAERRLNGTHSPTRIPSPTRIAPISPPSTSPPNSPPPDLSNLSITQPDMSEYESPGVDGGSPDSPSVSLRRLPRPLSRPLVLHSDFRGDGDVVLVCSDGGELVGFRVNGGMLRMASPILAALLKDKKPTTSVPHFVKVTDTPDDMHAFLRLLRFGTPSPSSSSPTAVPPPFFPTIAQYDAIQRLAAKYNGWYSQAVLDFHVELRAPEIVDRVGQEGPKEDIFALVRLAHNLHSSFLWAEICDRLRSGWWHSTLNPWKFEEADVDAVGDSIFSLLSILASVSSRDGLYSHIDDLCVMYSEEGDVSVAATERRPTGTCPTCLK